MTSTQVTLKYCQKMLDTIYNSLQPDSCNDEILALERKLVKSVENCYRKLKLPDYVERKAQDDCDFYADTFRKFGYKDNVPE